MITEGQMKRICWCSPRLEKATASGRERVLATQNPGSLLPTGNSEKADLTNGHALLGRYFEAIQ
jgi:hypothetical protein